jgi:CRISPR-associated protein (TIGR03986 family)
MSDFINPYNFVSPEKDVIKTSYIPRNSGKGLLNGRIVIKMKGLTPLITADSEIEYYSPKGIEVKTNSYPEIKDNENKNILYSEDKRTKTIKIFKPGNSDIASALTGTPQNMLNTINNWEEKHQGVFFISDGKDRVKSVKKTGLVAHAVKNFFNFENQYIIPPDSIKGSVRNIVEAISNSCFSIFHSEKENQLSYRQIPGNPQTNDAEFDTRYEGIAGRVKLLPARVEKIDKDNWQFKIYESARIKSKMLEKLAEKLRCKYKDLNGKLCKIHINYINIISIDNIMEINNANSVIKGYYKVKLEEFKREDTYAYFYLSDGKFYCKPKEWKKNKGVFLAINDNIIKDYKLDKLSYLKNKFFFKSVLEKKLKDLKINSIKKILDSTSKLYFTVGKEYYIKFSYKGTYPEIDSIECEGRKEELEHSAPSTKFTFDGIPPKSINNATVLTSSIDRTDYVNGYIKITGQKNAVGKNYERVFYNSGRQYLVDKDVVKKYESMLEEQIKICKPGNYGEHTFHDEKLKEGSLVYVRENNGKIDFITHICIPRIWFKKGPIEALENISPDLIPCKDINNLCPACELFGMVASDQNSLAGKVHFSPVFLISDPQIDNTPLPPLSSPKPTSVNFYLNHPDDNDKVVSYDSGKLNVNPQLRGRKFYFHHKPDLEELKKEEETGQNSTSDYLKENAEFIFSVDFYGLKKEEIGLLLLALQLLENCAYKVGMAKPLGFGSVENKFLDFKIFAPESRFSSLSEDGEVDATLVLEGKINKYIKFYNKPFDDTNLRIMLSKDFLNNTLIKYPRKTEGFKWFVDNKAQTLKTPEEIKKGHYQKGWS